jgi:uncharacterized protein YbjT (DUF2867 family)
MIAVMGAAGHVGGQVARLLLGGGHDVRVLEHRTSLDALQAAGAEVVSGDATEPATLRKLFAGAGAALVLLPDVLADPSFVATRSRISDAVAAALSLEGVGHVVMLSAMGVEQPDIAGPPAGLRELERHLRELERAHVLMLRSAFYMDYLLANLPLIESQGVNGSAIGADVSFPMIATADVAAEAAERLARRDFTGVQTKLLAGPADLTMREATRAIGARLGRPELPYVQFSPDGVRDAFARAGMSREAASLIVDMQLGINEGRPFRDAKPSTRTSTTLDAFLGGALPAVAKA